MVRERAVAAWDLRVKMGGLRLSTRFRILTRARMASSNNMAIKHTAHACSNGGKDVDIDATHTRWSAYAMRP